MWNNIYLKLTKLYRDDDAKDVTLKLKKLLNEFRNKSTRKDKKLKLSSSSIALITYANTFINPPEKPLKVLNWFIEENSINKISPIVHLLPFYPWDTDRGFSVTDFYQVEPEYGSWDDISELGQKVNLMFDFVINHASIKNPLVQGTLIERHLSDTDLRKESYKKYKDFCLAYSDQEKPLDETLKYLARPRPTPVLTPYHVIEKETGLEAILGKPSKTRGTLLGSGWVWTTFSRPQNPAQEEETRQVDLNFQNPEVLIESIKILLFYIGKGADLIRLDAIGYLWKKIGSSSLHERQTHTVLEIIHDLISSVAPNVVTIAEVNEEQGKILPYLGGKNKEADLVYQFTHFPLAVYTLLTKDTKPYLAWIKTTKIFQGSQFITVLGTHDGLGLKPVREFLKENQIQKLINILVAKHHALPNYASLPGGKRIVYELCGTPWNLINPPDSTEDFQIQLNRYLVVLALGLSHKGIPAIYVNGLLGTNNYQSKEGLDENRSVNREVFIYDTMRERLVNLNTQEGKVFAAIQKVLTIRASEPAFAPDAPPLLVLNLDNKKIIGILLESKKGKNIIQLVNVTDVDQLVSIDSEKVGKETCKDLIEGKLYSLKEKVTLSPYQTLWLK
ncbi:hypothetical protein A2715_02295 [Candidatus Woesebacteria bacterium RIFCSPHIGHO2_01_FULL_39_32]|uniref:Glycosyl hydrolase family 13 catalytic domain-containing protein n=1 Tax=Candidatus Woesebacteria bacterium RIFCSPLOWO2_01_FULL_39_25 TaxID=1802521 RepID=A0A1F8BJN8_9BACT|nr:MAG: hypothetical protein A2124_01825 [Candidatus Woesebacteria bacterium GWB1_37_5]OGM23981.1 MAG: hypothetical protein A2715_02295 [Candidatus Woesebacteria bacterium RIFCSPHIGHO2_01_FULL_39_32]OGM37487.1 MAG: hypothetical protein A3F01_03530 [Candidatus Woesebacteria bacterium RIFCSPHIGHO2_12_FULL_38_11]OGM64170.1 MAG: hypothetical protein A2893_03535 [Candidatus Woesebacteria bacterium RIFCSPLOWO2_01_FULL_39_25]